MATSQATPVGSTNPSISIEPDEPALCEPSDQAADSIDGLMSPEDEDYHNFSPLEPIDKGAKPISPDHSINRLTFTEDEEPALCEPSDKATSPANTQTLLHSSSPDATRTANIFDLARSPMSYLPLPTSRSKPSSTRSTSIGSHRGRACQDLVLNRDDTSLDARSQSSPPVSSPLQRKTSRIQRSNGDGRGLNQTMEDSHYVEEYPALRPSVKLLTSPHLGIPSFTPLTPSSPTLKRPRATLDDLGDMPPAKRQSKEDEDLNEDEDWNKDEDWNEGQDSNEDKDSNEDEDSKYGIKKEWERFKKEKAEKEELVRRREELRRQKKEIKKQEEDLERRIKQKDIEIKATHAVMVSKIDID